jgi:hypothetical protein
MICWTLGLEDRMGLEEREQGDLDLEADLDADLEADLDADLEADLDADLEAERARAGERDLARGLTVQLACSAKALAILGSLNRSVPMQ